MNKMNLLILPLPPSLNAAYNHRKDGKGRFKNPVTKVWENKADLMLLSQNYKSGVQPPYHIIYKLYFPKKNINDIANREKLLSDFLSSRQVIIDDSLIDHLEIIRGGHDKENPRAEICILPYESPKNLNKKSVIRSIKEDKMSLKEAMWLDKRLKNSVVKIK